MKLQQYLLLCLMEELSELQQEISKCLRFTPEHTHPAKGETNLEGACREWSDVIALLELLDETGLHIDHNDDQIEAKKERFATFLTRSIELGVIKE